MAKACRVVKGGGAKICMADLRSQMVMQAPPSKCGRRALDSGRGCVCSARLVQVTGVPHPHAGRAHGPRSRQAARLEIPRHRARLHREGHHALCAGRGLCFRPRRARRSQVRLRARTGGAADHGGGAGLSRQLAGEPGLHRRLQQGPARRADTHPASPAGTVRHRDRPHPQPGPARQGRRAKVPCCSPSARSSTRPAASRSPP